MSLRPSLGVTLWAHLLLMGRLPAQAPQPASSDSTFLLQSTDPKRAPSPFIGNGRLGIVVPALGLGPAPAYLAGLYEEAPGDVPRIVRIPAWSVLGVSNGTAWLRGNQTAAGPVNDYRQTLDMRSGTAVTEYRWGSGSKRTAVRVQTFVSRAAPSLAVSRLDLTPEDSGRIGVRFALTGWPRPSRLPLATQRRADPTWGPEDIWYPGHMIV